MIRRALISTVAAGLIGGSAVAQLATADDRTCRLCDFPEGWSLETALGSGYVSDDSFKFGDFIGLSDQGVFLSGDINADHWSSPLNHWRIEGRNLGIDSRQISIRGGQQGLYTLSMNYDKTPHTLFESGASPFLNPGTSSLSLPAFWVRGASTGDMSALSQSLRSVGIQTDRETFGLSLNFVQNPRLQYAANYAIARKAGTGLYGGSFLNTSTVLPRPVDFKTQTLDASVSYAGDSFHARVGYFGSLFRNETPRLRWDNPFLPIVPGAEVGQAALEPDNDFHQLTVSGQFQPLQRTQISGRISVGEMHQDEALQPFTVNPNLASPLPVSAFKAEVDTLHADVRLSARPFRKLRIRGSHTIDQRDNDTPITEWSYVAGEALPAGSRLNLPYGYERRKTRVRSDYRLHSSLKVSAGWERDVYLRDFAEVDRSEEDAWWGKLTVRAGDRADATLKYTVADRTANLYRGVPQVQPPQNPLLRKYNLANREREGFELTLSLRPADAIDLSIVAERTDDRYDASTLGLTDADFESLYADAAVAIGEKSSISAVLGFERYNSAQHGSQAFAGPDWRADYKDTTRFSGLRFNLPSWLDRLDIQFDYTFSETTGSTQTSTAGGQDAFPDLETELHSVELKVDYAWRENTVMRFGLLSEFYTVADWALDGIDEDTVPRVLGLGNQWLDYDVSVVMLSFVYSVN